jgi:hypothetical protein
VTRSGAPYGLRWRFVRLMGITGVGVVAS